MLIVEGDNRGDPTMTNWSLGFDSRLVMSPLRPPLSKKSFPVGRVGKKKRPAGRPGFSKIWRKENSSRPFLANPAGGQETFYLRVV